MITVFGVPKAFCGRIGTIQQNALSSWRWTFPDAQILLLGDDPGIAEAAISIGAEHLRQLKVNRFGTPLLNDVFDQAGRASRHRLLAFVNSDIILLPDFREAVGELLTEPCLMIGRSRDVRVEERIAFGAPNVALGLEALWRSGRSRGPLALEYFVFPRDLYAGLPPFVVGRARCDNWLVWRALSLGTRVVDASGQVKALHQVHDHSHLPGGLQETRAGIEAQENQRLAGWSRYVHLYSMLDCTHVLTPEGIRRRAFPRAALLRQFALRLSLRLSGR